MKKLEVIILCLLIAQISFAQHKPLFQIVENDRVGFIDDKGKVIIRPFFRNGGDFSEGLAPVRRNGMYGYIDSSGSFAIPPQFDFATDFVNGLSGVHKDGRSIFIDRTGRQVLDTHFVSLIFIDLNKVIVTTSSRKDGVMDIRTKKLLIDTIYSSISYFQSGAAIVWKYLAKRKAGESTPVGVIDSAGNMIVPFGRYSKIKPFIDGYAIVEIEGRKKDTDGLIDSKGNELFKISPKNDNYIGDEFHEGFAMISLSATDRSHEGYINMRGEVVLDEPGIQWVKDFSCGRAFITRRDGDQYLIDTHFKQVGSISYKQVLNDKFVKGYAVVETADGWGIIDTSANFIIKPQYEEIHRAGIVDNYFYFTNEQDDDSALYGIADLNNNIMVKPIMRQFDARGFVNGCIQAVVDDKLTYINREGHIVWQAKEDTFKNLRKLNIDFMNRGYFYAYSSVGGSGTGHSGGWYESANFPKKINRTFNRDSLSVTIAVNEADTFAARYSGYHLYISNTTKDTIDFHAQDSRLYVKLQALNSKGEWKDIEYLPSSWCGNSYHILHLEPGAYWKFIVPDYDGEFKTKVRAELKYIDKADPKKDKTVYSNIIEAGINPGQFWNKRKYYPGGLMDPYND